MIELAAFDVLASGVGDLVAALFSAPVEVTVEAAKISVESITDGRL